MVRKLRFSPAIFLAIAAIPIARAQSPAPPSFEAASIRPYITDASAARPGTVDAQIPNLNVQRGSTVTIQNLNLKNLIMLAYQVGGAQILTPAWSGDPEWATNRFSIVAKVSVGATRAQLPVMLQTLLAERFGLAVHHQQKETSVYVLEVSKPSANLKEVDPDVQETSGCVRSYGEAPGYFIANCRRLSSADLVRSIQSLAPGYFDKPAVDATGLTGLYDFSLTWAMKPVSQSEGGPTMFDAVEKLGLKLTSRVRPLDIIVVDQCRKMPTDN
ncbi:MAG TPA: TIGR03435 family protein [Bryobacteraceae bacterium]|nr:TIGR03435 family protein [Bryobacteraceae bacterium]